MTITNLETVDHTCNGIIRMSLRQALLQLDRTDGRIWRR